MFFNIINGPAIGHFQEIQNIFSYFWVTVLFAIALVEGQNILTGESDVVMDVSVCICLFVRVDIANCCH